MPLPSITKDISAADGAKIVEEAKSWKGTPYKLVGSGSIKCDGGDCSGSSWRIYVAVGLTYDYQATGTFIKYVTTKKRFRELAADEAKQEGDLLHWSSHMAIYTSFALDKENATTARVNPAGKPWTQTNDMWTATHRDGPAYRPDKMSYFKPTAPRVFRYQK